VDLKDYSEDGLNFSVNEFGEALGTVWGHTFWGNRQKQKGI